MPDETDPDDVVAALRGLRDEPLPAVRTDLATVVAVGRRRVLLRRTSTVLGAVAVVAVVTTAATLVGRESPAAAPAATAPSPRVLSTVPEPPPVAPGWRLLPLTPTRAPASVPRTPSRAVPDTAGYCTYPPHPLPPGGTAPVPAESSVVGFFFQTVAQLLPGTQVRPGFVSWPSTPGKPGAAAVLVTAPGGKGMITLDVRSYGGTALANADYQASVATECAPPQRRVLPDGGIAQLGAVRFPSVAIAEERAWVYTPGGHAYTLTVEGDSTGPGTDHWLPATPAQLAQLAQQVLGIG
jgi:hypothetical protein